MCPPGCPSSSVQMFDDFLCAGAPPHTAGVFFFFFCPCTSNTQESTTEYNNQEITIKFKTFGGVALSRDLNCAREPD